MTAHSSPPPYLPPSTLPGRAGLKGFPSPGDSDCELLPEGFAPAGSCCSFCSQSLHFSQERFSHSEERPFGITQVNS